MPKLKDTEYLSISARVRAMENRLLTRERMERMVEARSDEDAAKVLLECGYGELPTLTPGALDELLAKARGAVFADLRASVPDPGLLDVFQMKYDYHNAKVLIKAEAMGNDGARLLMDGGRYPRDKLADGYRRDDLRDLNDRFRRAIAEARELLASSGDPQRSDFVLDRAYFEEMAQAARDLGSDFLLGYVKLSIDVVNLRSVVRAARMNKGTEFLAQVLIPGGNVDVRALASAKSGDLESAFRAGRLAEAAALGASLASPEGGALTAFEKACDDAVTGYLAQARRIPFGEHPIIGYLYAREAEITAIRTIMSGRMAGLSGERIRERLREAYV